MTEKNGCRPAAPHGRTAQSPKVSGLQNDSGQSSHCQGLDPEPSPLRCERERLSLTIANAAKAAGVDYGTWWRCENGYSRTFPPAIRRLLNALGVNASELQIAQRAWIARRARRMTAALRYQVKLGVRG